MSKILVVAPHPDDETLGCGGIIARRIAEGHEVHWLIVTKMSTDKGFPEERIEERQSEIATVAQHYSFAKTHELSFDTTFLDTEPLGEIVAAIKTIFNEVQPDTLYIPYRGDAHSDHKVVFDACSAASKWFRAPYLKTILAYETLSETGYNLDPAAKFTPNWYEDIEDSLEKKINAMRLFVGETAPSPFPRSEECIRAQALLRGSESGYAYAEAFMLLRYNGSYQKGTK